MKTYLVCASVVLAAAAFTLARAQERIPERTAVPRVELRVQIDASPDTVWRTLTNPKLVKQWMLGVDTETDWKAGSPIVQRGDAKLRPREAKGLVVASERPRRLVHTHWNAGLGRPDRPENHHTISYALTESGDGTELTIVEENFANEEARQAAEASWQKFVRGLKAIAERRRASE